MALNEKKPVAKKTATPKRKAAQEKQDKPWDAATLAGFGIGTEEYLRQTQRPEEEADDYGDYI